VNQLSEANPLSLRSLFSTPTPGGRCYGSTRFSGYDLGAHLSDRVAETNTENRLIGVFQDIDDLPCRCFEIEASTIGEQVNVGAAADDIGEAFAAFLLQEAHDLSYPLQREPLAAQLTDNRQFGKVLHGIEPAMTLAFGLDDAPFVPPLELAGGDAGQGDYVVRWKAILHSSPAMFETIYGLNVSNILDMSGRESMRIRGEGGN